MTSARKLNLKTCDNSLSIALICSDGQIAVSTKNMCPSLSELDRKSIILPWNISVEELLHEIVTLGLTGEGKQLTDCDSQYAEILDNYDVDHSDTPAAENNSIEMFKCQDDSHVQSENNTWPLQETCVIEELDPAADNKLSAVDLVDAEEHDEDLIKLLYKVDPSEVNELGIKDENVDIELVTNENAAQDHEYDVLNKTSRGGRRKYQRYPKIEGDDSTTTCEKCSKTFPNRLTYWRHIRRHEKSKYECSYCHRLFVFKFYYDKHMLVHTAERKYKCLYCCNSYKFKKLLAKHMYSHVAFKKKGPRRKRGMNDASEVKESYQCQICGSMFRDLSAYNSHLVNHEMAKWEAHKYSEDKKSSRIFYCSYDNCRHYFLTTSALRDHVVNNHAPCPICNRHFTSKLWFLNHIQSHKKSEFELSGNDDMNQLLRQLGIGDTVTENTEDSLARGANSDNGNSSTKVSKQFPCSECDKMFVRPSDLHKHFQRVHHKPFKCPGHCDQSFGTRRQVKAHIMDYTGTKPYICSHCGKSFAEKASYNVHVYLHTGIKEQQCNNCGALFATRTQLTKHLLIHSGEKRYLCKICGKRFRTKDSHSKHQRYHSDIRPFTCGNCDKGFVTASHLRRHVSLHCHPH